MFGYSVKNILSETADIGIMLYPTDKLASVEVPLILKARNIPLDEAQLFRVCKYDINTMELTECKPLLVEWDCRRLKEPAMSPQSPETIQAHLAENAL